MKKVLLIVNPKAGKGLIKGHILEIVDILVKKDMDVTVYTTQKRLDAYEVTKRRAGEFELVVCSGGDGTLDEVVTGILDGEHTCPVGYIPAGSTNDFAHSLKIPSRMGEAARIITQDYPYACDIGSFNGDYFVYIAAFGVFTEVSYKTNQDMKNLIGHLAYVLNGAKSIFNIKPYKQLRIESEEMHLEGDFIYGMVANSESVGGFRNITGKNVQLNDGVFEVVLIRNPITPLDWEQVLSGLLTREADNKFVYFFKTNCIRIESEEEIAWTLDGEDGGKHREVEILNLKQAVEIMVRRPEKEKA
ncbi:MAG: YegS/Rv2252/BmrU family lipid kinase [Eubacteriales bacterium]|nr:YegS/Rv2252/BmrU family lipid kinase [Eubacteriales bacterium]